MTSSEEITAEYLRKLARDEPMRVLVEQVLEEALKVAKKEYIK